MVQPDRQALPRATLRAAFKVWRPTRARPGWIMYASNDYASDLDANLARLSESPARPALPAAGDPAALHSEAGKPGDASVGNSDGAGSGGADGAAHVIEPIFERDFAAQSYGFRPGMGCKDALRRVDDLLEGGLCPCGRCRPEKLLRHDSAGSPAGPAWQQGGRWPCACN